MRSGLGLLNSRLQDRDELVEVLLFTPDCPLQLAVVGILVVLNHLPATRDILDLLIRTSVQVDPGRLCRKTDTIRRRSSDGRLGWSGLRKLDLSTGIPDRSNQIRVIGDGVVVFGRNRYIAGGPVGRVSATPVLLSRRALTRDLKQLGSLGDVVLGPDDLDDFGSLDTLQIILNSSSRSVLTRAREVDTAN